MIENTIWKVSGHTTSDVTPSVMYTAEITNATKTYGPTDGISKIGLMYVSDYGFAAEPSAWTTTLNNYDGSANEETIRSLNWMHMGLWEWTMSPFSLPNDHDHVLHLSGYGNIENYVYMPGGGYAARPVFSLKSSVTYAGGSGTKDSPIILET